MALYSEIMNRIENHENGNDANRLLADVMCRFEDLSIALEVLLFRNASEEIYKCCQNEMVLNIASHFGVELKTKITTKERDKVVSIYKSWKNETTNITMGKR